MRTGRKRALMREMMMEMQSLRAPVLRRILSRLHAAVREDEAVVEVVESNEA